MSEKGASYAHEVQENLDLKRLLRKGESMTSSGFCKFLRLGFEGIVIEMNSFCVSRVQAL